MSAKFIVANWKMNGSRALIDSFVPELLNGLPPAVADGGLRVAICPPAAYLGGLGAALEGSGIILGAQNVHPNADGAFTGELSPPILADLGVGACIVGHSERRQLFAESNEFIGEKVVALQEAGIEPILCVGETLEQRESGRHEAVIVSQLRAGLAGLSQTGSLAVAYEPVWAIGTGKTATPDQANAMHATIRGILTELFGGDAARTVPLLYGGSVNGDNAGDLLTQPEIDGGLVGGASLKSESFLAIINHAK